MLWKFIAYIKLENRKKTRKNLKLEQKNLRIFEMNVRTGSLKAFRYICCMYTISILYGVWIFCELCAALNQNRTVHFPNPFPWKKSLKYLTIFTFRFPAKKKKEENNCQGARS